MSQATILALFFGRDDIPYQATWAGTGGATRSYAGFHQMANEQGRSRVYGGIHFEFDQVAGQSAGRNVACSNDAVSEALVTSRVPSLSG